MIKNRNIAPDAGIFPSKIMGGGMLGVGEIFFVCKTSDTAVYDWLAQRVPSGNLFPATDATADVAINAAVSACEENRNDYIVVMPSNSDYDITAAIALSKKCIHFVCPAGMGYDIGSNNSCRIEQTTDSTAIIAVSDSAIEVAGFYLKPDATTAGVDMSVAAVSYALNVHHNYFVLKGSVTNGAGIEGTGDGGAWGNIERNNFITQVSSATFGQVISIGASATGTEVSHNQVSIGNGSTATVGIQNSAVLGNTNFNIFSECGGSGAPSGGTITNCVAINESASAIGNRCAVAAGKFASGGTAARSFCDNIDGASGTGGGMASQLES